MGRLEYRPKKSRSLFGLDWVNFFLIDPQTGIGSFLPVYLAAHQWNEQLVGVALSAGSLSGILSSAPAGAIVDSISSKRALVALSTILLALCSLWIALEPSFWSVLISQVLIGSVSTPIGPAICAISLGIVGRKQFDLRQGRNQMFNSAGKILTAIVIGLTGYMISDRSVFFFVAFLAIPILLSLSFINPADINYQLARGADKANGYKKNSFRHLFHPQFVIFLTAVVLFNFANAAIFPLLGQLLSKDHGNTSMLFISMCVVTTQLVITQIAPWSGKKAGVWGRKPLLLIAFGVLPIRAFLYTLTHSIEALIPIQVLDGISAGIFSVVSVLMIADLTKGTGRFNLALGITGASVGIGSALSQVIAGSIVKDEGYPAGFLFLAMAGIIAFLILFFFVSETKDANTSD